MLPAAESTVSIPESYRAHPYQSDPDFCPRHTRPNNRAA
ncbi:hypothetical protein E2C01_062817 [Portunus trituberculatus]|uniref:Uncharacterized protein n=1 Tax=Portunus trituberculatus TaxID=210409 RepID=A0A5B7HGH4_PORTR|nr:hypothetical protein [Portunus trituberculatus]